MKDIYKQPTLWSKVVDDKGWVWYIPEDIDNKGDHIHVSTPNKNGYAGSTLQFTMNDGSVDKVVGPWHSNSESLLRNTGIDLKDTHYTRFIICENTKLRGNSVLEEGVLYDTGWQLGYFDSQPNESEMAEFIGKGYQYTRYGVNGSMSGSVDKHLKVK